MRQFYNENHPTILNKGTIEMSQRVDRKGFHSCEKSTDHGMKDARKYCKMLSRNIKGSGKVITDQHSGSDQHQNLTTPTGSTIPTKLG